MRRIIPLLIIVSFLATAIVGVAVAVDPGATTSLPDKTVQQILTSVADWLFTILLAVTAIIVVIAAFQFLTSAGDPEKVTGARNLILYAVIALVVAAMAKGLAAIVKKMVT